MKTHRFTFRGVEILREFPDGWGWLRIEADQAPSAWVTCPVRSFVPCGEGVRTICPQHGGLCRHPLGVEACPGYQEGSSGCAWERMP